jgi:hypothetical protein
MEDPTPYLSGPANASESPLATDALIAQAHANRQGILCETGYCKRLN